MRTSSTVTPRVGESGLPSLFLIGGYRVFFWSNEAGEPVHVHVRKGAPYARMTPTAYTGGV